MVPARDQIAAAFRSPVVPELFSRLQAEAPDYLDCVWPILAQSLDTAGFLGSTLYMADMALDACLAVYEPVHTPSGLVAAGLARGELDAVSGVLDIFQYLQPQALLAGAALAEAFERPTVGGQGRAEPRQMRDRERRHLETVVPRPAASVALLSEVAAVLQVDHAPQLYRSVARWPRYLELVWEELQHLASYPDFRRRGRSLYYYARSGARFLAQPLEANPEALARAGVSEREVEWAREVVDAQVPALATMMMHASAMRLGLGRREYEVVGVNL